MVLCCGLYSLAFLLVHAKFVNQGGNQSCPSCLVTRSCTGSRIAVEVLVEGDVIAPVRIVLELVMVAKHGAASVTVSAENVDRRDERSSDTSSNVSQLPDPTGTFDAHVGAEVVVQPPQGVNQKVIGRHPDGPRQFEFPPNSPVEDSAGSYFTE